LRLLKLPRSRRLRRFVRQAVGAGGVPPRTTLARLYLAGPRALSPLGGFRARRL